MQFFVPKIKGIRNRGLFSNRGGVVINRLVVKNTRSGAVWPLVFLSLIVGIACAPLAQARSLPDFTSLVERSAGAVVNISTTSKREGNQFRFNGRSMPDIPKDSPFYDFFERFFNSPPSGRMIPEEQRTSLGSGFIMSEDGYVITNNHVVEDADEIIVRLNDRREFQAEVIGTDKRSDLAVLKIDAGRLPTLTLGNSSTLQVGEWVLAIGSPFGFEHSVTQGIISAMGRSLPSENYVPFIQTDVAINPGNSGGPLFNLQGEVIGVNSQIYSRTGGFMGMSFAIPVNVVKDVYRQLREGGYVSRGWLGVLIQDVTRELAESFNMDKPRGALVSKIIPDSPAEGAGFEVGDIIVEFDGKEVGVSTDLPPMVGATRVDRRVDVGLIRKGKEIDLEVKIAELPTSDEGAGRAFPGRGGDDDNPLNVTVRALTDKERERMELEDHGVLVEEVMPGPAYAAGIREGDVLVMFDNVKIDDPGHFAELAEQLPEDESVPLLVLRRGSPLFLALKIERE